MFEYTIEHYQKHPPSKRFFVSWTVSCLAHVCAVLILIRYPELLRGGMNLWFRPPAADVSQTPPKTWRSVAVLGSLEMPPDAVLKRNIYDWSKPKSKATELRPIHINMHSGEALVPPPAPKQEPRPVPVNPVPAGGAQAVSGAAAAGTGDVVRTEPPIETKKPPIPSPPAAAQNQTPTQIPKGVSGVQPSTTASAPPPGSGTNAQSRPPTKSLQDQQTGARVQGGILFDNKGFNLDEFEKLIEERVKGNWEIPSNLRQSHGSTTILFYITRDGRYSDAKIEVSSGNMSLDIAALYAVTRSNPFPPLPQGFPADRVGARFVFAYNERK
jgi:TonB family protein